MLRYRHNDMQDLEKKLQKVPEGAGCLIVTDGVFSMGGDIANLPEICRLAKQYGARVMVDDAHGLGVNGEGGRGTASYYGLEDQVDVYMGTFSKSWQASVGTWRRRAAWRTMCGTTRAHLSSRRPFRLQNCAAALAALRELEAHPELVTKLQKNALYLRKRLSEEHIRMRESNGEIVADHSDLHL